MTEQRIPGQPGRRPEPIGTPAFEDLWNTHIPHVMRWSDEAREWFMKRYMMLIGDQYGEISTLVDRFTYIAPPDRNLRTEESEIDTPFIHIADMLTDERVSVWPEDGWYFEPRVIARNFATIPRVTAWVASVRDLGVSNTYPAEGFTQILESEPGRARPLYYARKQVTGVLPQEGSWDAAVGLADAEGNILLDNQGRVAHPGEYPYWDDWEVALWQDIESAPAPHWSPIRDDDAFTFGSVADSSAPTYAAWNAMPVIAGGTYRVSVKMRCYMAEPPPLIPPELTLRGKVANWNDLPETPPAPPFLCATCGHGPTQHDDETGPCLVDENADGCQEFIEPEPPPPFAVNDAYIINHTDSLAVWSEEITPPGWVDTGPFARKDVDYTIANWAWVADRGQYPLDDIVVQTAPANGEWRTITTLVTMPDTVAFWAPLWAIRGISAEDFTAGDYFDVAEVLITDVDDVSYFDGDLPGARWDGLANRSTSRLLQLITATNRATDPKPGAFVTAIRPGIGVNADYFISGTISTLASILDPEIPDRSLNFARRMITNAVVATNDAFIFALVPRAVGSSWDKVVGLADNQGNIIYDPDGDIAQPGLFPHWDDWEQATWELIEYIGVADDDPMSASPYAFPVTSGQLLYLGCRMRCFMAGRPYVHLSLICWAYDRDRMSVSMSDITVAADIPTDGQWRTYLFPITMPPGAHYFTALWHLTGWTLGEQSNGDYFDIADILVTDDRVDSQFDGDFPNGRWYGGPNNSASALMQPLPEDDPSAYVLQTHINGAFVRFEPYLADGEYWMTFDYLRYTHNGTVSVYVNEVWLQDVVLDNSADDGAVITSPRIILHDRRTPQEYDRLGGNDGLDMTDGHGQPLRGSTVARGWTSIKFQYDSEKQPMIVIGGMPMPDPNARINVAAVTIVQTREGYDFATSDLVNAYGANAEWLPWLAMIVGTRLDLSLRVEEQRDAIVNGLYGIKAGTRESMARAAQRYLVGSRSVAILDHTIVTSDGTIVEGGQWDVTISVRDDELPRVDDGQGGLMPMPDAQFLAYLRPFKPAGVTLYRTGLRTSWDIAVGLADEEGNIIMKEERVAFPGVFPYWVNWNNALWSQIERAGLD